MRDLDLEDSVYSRDLEDDLEARGILDRLKANYRARKGQPQGQPQGQSQSQSQSAPADPSLEQREFDDELMLRDLEDLDARDFSDFELNGLD